MSIDDGCRSGPAIRGLVLPKGQQPVKQAIRLDLIADEV
jgi:hypothetical protein